MCRLIPLLLRAALLLAVSGPLPAAETAASAPLNHRPLRTNVEPAPPTPTEPRTFDGYPGVLPFSVIPRQGQLTLFPCSTCHAALKPNPVPRKLVAAPHASDLPHGNGRIWCLNCHHPEQRDQLRLLDGKAVGFDRSDQVCGQCHGDRHRDWHYGGHGKRDANWTGDRRLYACTHCHDPHSPALKPRAPQPPPPVRAGLARRNAQE